MATEHTVQDALLRRIALDLPGAMAVKHTERVVAGVPDVSLSWLRFTSWWELKHLDPDLEDDPRQRFLIRKLSARAEVRYVLYSRHGTQIVRPEQLVEVGGKVVAGGTEMSSARAYDHRAVVAYMRDLHERGTRR